MPQRQDVMITGSLPIAAQLGVQTETSVDPKHKTTNSENTNPQAKVGEFQHLLKQTVKQLDKKTGKVVEGQPGADLTQLLAKLEAKISGKEAGITFSKEDLQKLVAHFQKNDLPANVKENVLKQLNSSLKEQLPERMVASSSNKDFKEIVDALRTKTGKEDVEQLIQNLKTEMNHDVPLEGYEEAETLESAEATPMDFLIKESKGEEKTKVKSTHFMPSEDFASLKSEKPLNAKTAEVAKNNLPLENAIKENNQNNDVESLIKNLKSANIATPVLPKAHSGEAHLQDILKTEKSVLAKSSNDERKKEITLEDILSKDTTSVMKDGFFPQVTKVDNAQIFTQDGQKVLDLSKLNTTNTSEIINNISNYIQQNQIMNRDSLDLSVYHEELGQFKINVSKNVADKSNAIDLQIVTSSTEGHEFFTKHEVALMKNLSQAGVQLAEFKIVAGGENAQMAQGDSRQNQPQHGQFDQKQNMKFSQNDSSDGSQRRKELWQQAQNFQKFGA